MILQLETATKNCSVALSNLGETVFCKEISTATYSHAEKLHQFVLEVLQEAQVDFKDLQAVAVSKGPGSYTGLRIGVSAAKGYCVALNIPLIAIETLEVLTQQVNVETGLLIPMIDARRMEVYTAVFDANKQLITPTHALVIDENSFTNRPNTCYVFGDGAAKTQPHLLASNFVFLEDILFPSAKDMSALAYQKFLQNSFEDVAYFEPYYLKEFMI